MNYITTTQAAKIWNISSRRISNLAQEGRIPDAIQVGSRWMIPEGANKPIDARTKTAKTQKNNNSFFRYPIFEGRNIDSFNPPLDSEELTLKEMSEAFHACNFELAETILNTIQIKSLNKYNRISVLYGACMIYFMLNNPKRFVENYSMLLAELEEDFPHKKEMSSFVVDIKSILGNVDYYKNSFTIDNDYSYHKTFLPHLASQSILALNYSKNISLSINDLLPYELICCSYDNENCFLDSMAMHLYLGVLYGLSSFVDKMKYHIKKAFELSEKYELYFLPATMYFYYRKLFDVVLEPFPEKTKKRIQTLSKKLHANYESFLNSISRKSFFNLLNSNDYIYIFYAAEGYSNKEIAIFLHTSESTVGNRYSIIYQTLGVKNKTELVEYYRNSITSLINNDH